MWEEGRLAPGRLRDGAACNKSDRQRQGREPPRRRLSERSVRSPGESRISIFLDELAPPAIFLHDLTFGAWRAVGRRNQFLVSCLTIGVQSTSAALMFS